jgi:hypothetical protein
VSLASRHALSLTCFHPSRFVGGAPEGCRQRQRQRQHGVSISARSGGTCDRWVLRRWRRAPGRAAAGARLAFTRAAQRTVLAALVHLLRARPRVNSGETKLCTLEVWTPAARSDCCHTLSRTEDGFVAASTWAAQEQLSGGTFDVRGLSACAPADLARGRSLATCEAHSDRSPKLVTRVARWFYNYLLK